MKAQGLGATAIAKALGSGRATVYRVLEAQAHGVRLLIQTQLATARLA